MASISPPPSPSADAQVARLFSSLGEERLSLAVSWLANVATSDATLAGGDPEAQLPYATELELSQLEPGRWVVLEGRKVRFMDLEREVTLLELPAPAGAEAIAFHQGSLWFRLSDGRTVTWR